MSRHRQSGCTLSVAQTLAKLEVSQPVQQLREAATPLKGAASFSIKQLELCAISETLDSIVRQMVDVGLHAPQEFRPEQQHDGGCTPTTKLCPSGAQNDVHVTSKVCAPQHSHALVYRSNHFPSRVHSAKWEAREWTDPQKTR